MNADMGKKGGPRGYKKISKQGKSLLNFSNKYNLTSVNLMNYATGPIDTHVGPTGKSAIDHILIPATLMEHVVSSQVLDDSPLNVSDHRPVTCYIKLGSVAKNTSPGKTKRTKRWDKWSNEDIREKYTTPVSRQLNEIYNLITICDISPDNIDRFFTLVTDAIKKAASAVPTSKFRPHLRPYWDENLSALKREKLTKYKKWKKAGSPKNPDSILWLEHKFAKKSFAKALRTISRNYENEQIKDVVNSVGMDKTHFWRLLKRARNTVGSKTLSIRNHEDKVVHDVPSVLKTWKTHFENLCSPKEDSSFDSTHFRTVSENINTYKNENDNGAFLNDPITEIEVAKAIKNLHLRKACGFDGIGSEEIIYAGDVFVKVITLLFNIIIQSEYIPENLRRGIQIPLFKGKNLCSLDCNNYRGITLLTNYNKLFEMVIWSRIKGWWYKSGVVSEQQGACRSGQSCVHSGLLLQETVSRALETNRNVFVSYYDVSKAFDTVWTDGLFWQLYQKGLTGRLWRLLYSAYVDFKCRVRIGDEVSDWYTMLCGIHQGGYLSLMKYTAFINPLLEELVHSGLCCSIDNIKSNPVGYADDLATATTSKTRTDCVNTMVYNYSRKWRFTFNAKKSAVLTYGETKAENARNTTFRVFRLGKEKIPEKQEYDHLGVKATIDPENENRVCEKIAKGRRTLNASSGLGIRKNGLNMISCNLIFWSVVMPILSFGSEIWILNDKDHENIQNFQRYAGRRIQRFPQRSPNNTSFFGLGWIKITTFIMIKKILFLLTILRLETPNIIKEVFLLRLDSYLNDIPSSRRNIFHSPIFEILNSCSRLGMLNMVIKMANGSIPLPGKKRWAKLAWENAWALDDAYWKSLSITTNDSDILYKSIGQPRYLSWWQISDNLPEHTKMCECMARIVCKACMLKSDDYRLKGLAQGFRTCTNCDLYAEENIRHILMQCPALENDRVMLYDKLYNIDEKIQVMIYENPHKVFLWLLGGNIEYLDIEIMIRFWIVAGYEVTRIYRKVTQGRDGIG